MFTDTITYTDYDGNERTETAYFNLSKPELIKLEYSVPGGMEKSLDRILKRLEALDTDVIGEMFDFFEQLLVKSYGIKSDDGKRFVKSQEITDEFIQSELYSEIFMKFTMNPDYVHKFILGVMPSDISAEAQQNEEVQKRLEAFKEATSSKTEAVVSEN